MKNILLSICLLLASLTAFSQGSTTAAISGIVQDGTGESLPGATVIAVHQPSGSQYGAVTNEKGFYRLPNMRVGGPYTLTVSFIGYEDYLRTGIELGLGQNLAVDVNLEESSEQLEAVEVVASEGGVIDGDKTGAQTSISEEVIESLPTVSRSLGDFVRYNPQANVQEGSDGYSISLGGLNNRFNAIYIDGAVNNDVFGLAGSGTNGGQTGVSPISVDAIQQFEVAIAPFDVRQSGFAGGSINAVTRSGTNDFIGSAYYFFRNESLAGNTPTDDPNRERTKLAPFTAKTYGARLGGPILQDKAFFFVNVEMQRDETPQPFDFSTYEGDASRADINNLIAKLQGFGYNPGVFENNTAFLNSDKLLGRFDFNLGRNHKLMLRHAYTRAENLEAVRSSTRSINFINASEYFESITNSTSIELSSVFGNTMANKLIIGYTSVRDDRDPSGDPFPSVFIQDGDGSLNFGSEQFSTANQLDQDVLTITNNFELFSGRHTLTFGTHNEFYKTYNLFIRQNFGFYQYDSLAEFINDMPAQQYDRSYSLIDDITGDGSAAAAQFKGMQLGFYVQDEFQVNQQLILTGGLRVDIPIFNEDTPENQDFNTTTVPLIEAAGYDLRGARTGKFVDPQFMFSPRMGFNYDLKGDKTTQLRGGIGIFNSRIPLVWPGAAYNNNGALVGGDRLFSYDRNGNLTNPIYFNPNVNEQPRSAAPGAGQPSGQIDLFADDFKFPQVWKANLAVDQKLPGDIYLTLEGLYTGFMNNVYYQNLNLKPSTENATGTPDDRPLYNRRDPIDDTYTGIYLGSNTDKGYTYNLTAQLQKQFTSGFFANLAYTYGDAYTIYDGTSSQNSSQWRGLNTVDGRNNFNTLYRSDFSAGSRVMAGVSYKKEYAGFAATQISLFYNGQAGQPFTYIVGNANFTNEDSRERSLMYVPANSGEIIFGDDGVPFDAATQAELYSQLNRYIAGDDYLSERRGQYTQRNMNRTPFESILDLRLLQDFYVEMADGKRNTLQLSLDVYNVGNLFNKDWGRRYFVSNGQYELVQFDSFQPDGTTPLFQLSLPDEDPWEGNIDDSGIRSARVQAQLGIRYIFGN